MPYVSVGTENDSDVKIYYGHRVERLGDLLGVVRAGAVEEQVLDEMRDAARSSRSSRDPAPIQKPSDTERTLGTFSEITRSPESSSESTYFCTRRS